MDTNVFTYYIETESDVLNLIDNEIEENLNLDYKACASLQKTDGKKREVGKDISALANSNGGTIIYGVIEEGHIAKDIDEGYDPNVITKEWLEDVINSNARPRIDGIKINPIKVDTKDPSKVIYAVHVPQSTTAHQASDKRYYKRFNFQSVPMEHYEIEDVMNRCKHPIITPHFSKKNENITPEEHHYRLLIKLKNEGTVCAEHIKFIIEMPLDIIDFQDYRDQERNYHERHRANFTINERIEINKKRTTSEISLNYSVPGYTLFPNDEKIISFNLKYKVDDNIYAHMDQ